MTQRSKTPIGLLETAACEKFVSRFLENELKLKPKSKEKCVKQSFIAVTDKEKPRRKSSLGRRSPSPKNSIEYADESALVKVTVKAPKKRQTSQTRGWDHEPWGQLLKFKQNTERISIFKNFDPLRTLHFLTKELEFQISELIPEQNKAMISQMIQDMQAALKRVPPDVASAIHLQQHVENTEERGTQSLYSKEDFETLTMTMKEKIQEFQNKYTELEAICNQLRIEKDEIEQKLLNELENVSSLKIKIGLLEIENDQLIPQIKTLTKDKEQMQVEIDDLKQKYDSHCSTSINEMRKHINDAKSTKVMLEQENARLKHQIRIMNLEKEKYLTVLTARDRQINEIRNEMTQLQEAVNEQLVEIQKGSVSKSSINIKSSGDRNKKENIGDWTPSACCSKEDQIQINRSNKPSDSMKDSGDIDVTEHNIDIEIKCHDDERTISKELRSAATLGPLDSHTSIRSLFNEVKKAAMSISAENFPNNLDLDKAI